MHQVTFLPMNLTVPARDGDTILEVAIANDIPLEHACGGYCACTTCHVQVKAGMENLAPMDEEEEERIETVDRLSPSSRLGCQSKVQGNITVEIMNLDT
jgi:2Fe-2S ferredoxin